MKKIVFIFFLLAFANSVFAQSQEKLLIVSLDYSDGNISFSNAFIQPGVFASTLDTGDISGIIYSTDNQELFAFKFDLDKFIAVENEGIVEQKQFKQTIVLPYFENAEKISFKNNETGQELVVPVSFLSKLCGNGSCDASESFGNCSTDCPSGGTDDYCDRKNDNICDSDCKPKWMDQDCTPEIFAKQKSPMEIEKIVKQEMEKQTQDFSGLFSPIAITVALVIALIVLAIFINQKKNKTNKH